MLIPVRCYTCGEILSDKWMPYISAVQNDKNKINETIDPEKSIEGKILDELELHKYCCRRMMLGNVHIISYLS